MRTSIKIILVVWLMSAATAVFAQKGQPSVEQAFEKALKTMQKEGYGSPILQGFGQDIYALLSFSGQQ